MVHAAKMLRLLAFSCCSLSVFALAANGKTLDNLSFRVGETLHELEPQELPPFLHEYHSQAMNLTGKALSDDTLDYIPNVSYGPEDRQRLDVWKHKDAVPGGPIVVFVHGGGWDWGYREWAGFAAQHVCKMDKSPIFVTPSYAIGKGETQMWPDARNDIVQVLDWIQSSAKDQHGGNPNQVFLAGHSAGGHLAASVAMNPALLRQQNLDPSVIRGLFLISAPLGLRAQDFFPARLWRLRFITRPFLKLLYRGVFLKVLAPVVGKREERRKRFDTATEASPLFFLESMKDDSTNLLDDLPHTIHYSYGASGDFPICRPHLKRLEDLLGDKRRVQSLEMPVDSHFETHFSLADGESQWYKDLHTSMS